MYDAIIVGAGISGCAVARELSRYEARICVVEREEDVCCGTSKANSAIVHAGFDAQTGSLMAKLNVEGNALMYQLAEELGFKCDQCGSLVVCVSEETRPGLQALLERGLANGVEGLRIIERDELEAMEPHISDAAVAALWAPTGGIVDPFELTVALAENAATNGVEFRFEEQVQGVMPCDDGWLVQTSRGELRTRSVINAAGVYADDIHNAFVRVADGSADATDGTEPGVVRAEPLSIVARKGEYYLLDTTASDYVRHTIFMLPSAMGKGVLVSPTVHGNLIVGPTATDVDDKESTDTTAEGLAEVASKSSLTVKDVPLREVITTFAGLRAHQAAHDFVIGEVSGAPGLFDCAAIESPGLTSAPAIGRMVAGLVAERMGLAERQAWMATREAPIHVADLDIEAWNDLCAEKPAFGRIICRCRRVSEAEIVESIHRVPGARSLDSVKRRTFATAGRCQGGFCSPKIMEILERELGLAPEEVNKCGTGSELVVGRPKDHVAKPATTQEGGDLR